jgi:hypothetical protein
VRIEVIVICAVLQYKVRSWEYGKRLKQPLVAVHLRRLTHEGLTQLTNLRYRHHSGLYTSENGDGSRCQRRGLCSRRWMTSMRSARWTSRERPVLPRLQRRANIAPQSIYAHRGAGLLHPKSSLTSRDRSSPRVAPRGALRNGDGFTDCGKYRRRSAALTIRPGSPTVEMAIAPTVRLGSFDTLPVAGTRRDDGERDALGAHQRTCASAGWALPERHVSPTEMDNADPYRARIALNASAQVFSGWRRHCDLSAHRLRFMTPR